MSDNDNQITPKESQGRTFNEELEVAGNQLVERVKELIEEGNVRRLIIRNPEGRTLLEIPLTFGAVAGGALVIFFGPVLAALADRRAGRAYQDRNRARRAGDDRAERERSQAQDRGRDRGISKTRC
ncbi:MAG: DUF4342 domain-containing protein [Anaerolineae bacterium]